MFTFRYKLVRRVHVAVHGPHSPTATEWHAYLENIGEWIHAIDAVFSYTVGGGPDGRQRGQAVSFWQEREKQPPIAVVTPSLLVVRMAGALRWFMPSQIKAFTPANLRGAFDYLRLDGEQRAAVEAALKQLAAEQNLLGVGLGR
jgi:hypothetical protein